MINIDNVIKIFSRDLNIESEVWYKGNRFSQFSSASGFNTVSKILLESYKK